MKLGTIGHYFTGRVCMAAIVVQSWLNQIDGEPLVSVMAWNEDGSANPQRIVPVKRADATNAYGSFHLPADCPWQR